MSPFGNKIKALREAQNLTQTDLAELIGLSTQYISFLERGERKPSPATIEKFAKYFNVATEELLRLRDEEMTYPTLTSSDLRDQNLPEDILEYNGFLLSLDEEMRLLAYEASRSEVNKRFQSLLKQYNFREVKNEVLAIRSKWTSVNLSTTSKSETIVVLRGSLNLDKSIYFSIEYNHNMMKLVLQTENHSHIKTFEEWMDHHHVSYLTEERIPHITKEQKMVQFYWFSPITSSFDKYNILTELQIDLRTVDVYDNQLNWLIQSQPKNNTASNNEEMGA